MAGPRRTYPYRCPSCGAEVLATAAYRARQQLPCLACTRERNGWEHQPGCAAPADHRGPCSDAGVKP